MSDSLDRESLSSTFASLGGAWIGLGAGLLFLFSSTIVAMTEMTIHGGGAEQVRILHAAVTEETISSLPGAVDVRAEGRKLVIQRSQANDKPVTVVFLFNPESGVVSKIVGGSGKDIAKLDSVKFHHSDGRLFVKCEAQEHQSKRSWATSRWKVGAL